MTEPKAKILVVDDEASMREFLEILLASRGYAVRTAPDGPSALAAIAEEPVDLVIQDLRMPGMDGLDLLRRIKGREAGLPVVIITAFSTWDNAVEAMRLGAYDYIKKPFDTSNIESVVGRALDARHVSDPAEPRRDLVGNDRSMREVYALIKKVAPTDSTVLITGESGTGKELVARAIHERSPRVRGRFVSINCSAFTETLLESELFGHVRGAFTGAVDDRKGLFAVAHQGTLFLDEIADMSPATQVRILRVLEERRVLPVGGTEEVRVDVRIIAATNRAMEDEIQKGRFREDLYYRLNVIPVTLPPLRERKGDIPLLAGHFLAKYARQMGKDVRSIAALAQRTLLAYDWPGNVRELENIIQRHVALCDGPEIAQIHVGRGAPCPASNARTDPFEIPESGLDLDRTLETIERGYLARALDATEGNMTNAARLLGMSYRSIRYKVKKLRVRASG